MLENQPRTKPGKSQGTKEVLSKFPKCWRYRLRKFHVSVAILRKLTCTFGWWKVCFSDFLVPENPNGPKPSKKNKSTLKMHGNHQKSIHLKLVGFGVQGTSQPFYPCQVKPPVVPFASWFRGQGHTFRSCIPGSR